MASRVLRVLVVEDSLYDAELVLRYLRKAGYVPEFERVDSRQTMESALKKQAWDLVISDHSLPGFDSRGALSLLKEYKIDIPFILVSGAIGEDLAAQIMRAGAHDFIVKNNLARLGAAVDRELKDAEVRKAQRAGEAKLRWSSQMLRQAFEGSVQALAKVTEMRDPYTAGHQHRVAELSCAIARELGFSEEATEGLRLAGLIHDLGKMGVPAEILSKPGALTSSEFSLVKTHPRAGYDILKGIAFPWPVAEIVHQHHERCNGSGYPQGLIGDKILIEARILGVADVVEAMSSHRPYRPSLGREAAILEIRQQQGVLYDPRIVAACLKIFPGMEFINRSQCGL